MARAEKSSTCEELNLFGRAALVKRVSPALRLRLHHRVVVVPAIACEDKQKKKGSEIVQCPGLDGRGSLLAARYLPPSELGNVIPLLLASAHVQHAVGSAHGSLCKGGSLHTDVGDAFPPFTTGWVVPGRMSVTKGSFPERLRARTPA